MSFRTAEAPSPGPIPSSDRTTWLSCNILPHEPALRAWLRRRAGRGLEVDDIVQETYAVLAGLTAVDHILAPRAYAFQTALSVILQHARRLKVVRMDAVADMAALRMPADEPSAESRLSARQDLQWTHEVIRALPVRQREAFTLRRIEGLSQREIARRMGISESTVEKHIAQALRALMLALKRRASLA